MLRRRLLGGRDEPRSHRFGVGLFPRRDSSLDERLHDLTPHSRGKRNRGINRNPRNK